MFKTIIAATDGSEHARKAVTIAGDIAGRYGAGLDIVNIVQSGRIPEELQHMAEVERLVEEPAEAPSGADQLGRLSTEVEADGKQARLAQAISDKLLEQAEAAARRHGATTVERHSLGGDPAEAILDLARQRDADLIVMGTRGLGEIKGLLVGSVSHKIQQMADAPVLTVK